jgi:hypothetical protein
MTDKITHDLVEKACNAFSDGEYSKCDEQTKMRYRLWMRKALAVAELEWRTPRARRTDPSTSMRAALTHAPRARSHRAIVLKLICRWTLQNHPQVPLTSEEIGRYSGVNGAWKRVSDLLEGGFIEVAGEKEASTGKMQQTYKPTQKGWDWWNAT